ncbi:MAG: hypothetical protein INR73_15645 [Williamsia sp.]|nr:hypothetical protein [Williamsia sp.]
MKKLLFSILVLLSLHASTQAQDGGNNRVEAYKIAYITNRLSLTTAEAQKFWPIYNRYTSEIKQVKTQNPDMGEIEMEEKVVNIRKKYKTEFAQAISDEKVNQFFKIDKEFNNVIRKELQERRQDRRNNKPF